MTVPSTPTAAALDHIHSPASSDLTSSSSMNSVDLLASVISRSLQITEDDDSGDEIVWDVSEKSSSSNSSDNEQSTPCEDEFILISRPHSPSDIASSAKPSNVVQNGVESGPHAPITRSIIEPHDRLRATTMRQSLTFKKKGPQEGKRESQKPQPTNSKSPKKFRKKKAKKTLQNIGDVHPNESRPSHTSSSVHPTQTQWFEEMALVKSRGLGSRSVVDDYSDGVSVISVNNESVNHPTTTIYEEASTFISSFLSNPDAKNDTVCKLTLLQSLIIELGLATASLPESLSAAKAFLKSRAFLNVREYLAVREQGPEAVQRVLYPSKSALIKDIKNGRNRASLKWVKRHGLQVFLVGWTHH